MIFDWLTMKARLFFPSLVQLRGSMGLDTPAVTVGPSESDKIILPCESKSVVYDNMSPLGSLDGCGKRRGNTTRSEQRL